MLECLRKTSTLVALKIGALLTTPLQDAYPAQIPLSAIKVVVRHPVGEPATVPSRCRYDPLLK